MTRIGVGIGPIVYSLRAGFCDEYQTVYDAFTTPPSSSVAAAQDTMVKTLVDGAVWDDLDVFQGYAQSTNSDGEALLNWKSPTDGDNLVDADASAGEVCDQWSPYGTNTVACVDDVITITYVDSAFGARIYMRDADDLNTDLTIGQVYVIRLYMKVAGSFNIKIEANPDAATAVSNTSYEWVELMWQATSATANYFIMTGMGAGDVLYIDQWEVRETSRAIMSPNSPTFTSLEGFTGNGSSMFLQTGFSPKGATNYAQDDACFGIYVRTNVDEAKDDCGMNFSGGAYIRTRDSGNATLQINSSTSTTTANTDSRGMFTGVRADSANHILYINKVADQQAAASVALVDGIMIVLASANSAGTAQNLSSKQISFFFAGKALSAAKVTILTDAIETYMDSNGKGVIS
jgi:hypothetical protein